MKSLCYWLVLIVSITLLVSSCSEEDAEEFADTATTTDKDAIAPVIAEVAAVTTPTNDITPNYTFSSDEAGTIAYGGSCSSENSSAIKGNTTVTISSLSDSTYSDCTVTVTDNASNTSNTLALTSFVVDSTAPTVTEVTAVTTPDNDTTPDYTFSSTEAGTITYGGACHSSTSSANSGNTVITLVSLRDGTYNAASVSSADNCTITVTDNASNVSNSLALTSFIIDTTAATLEEVTAVTTPTNDYNPNYTFSSDEAGNIT